MNYQVIVKVFNALDELRAIEFDIFKVVFVILQICFLNLVGQRDTVYKLHDQMEFMLPGISAIVPAQVLVLANIWTRLFSSNQKFI